MQGYDYVFFDLDGTLTDPALGITNAIMYALSQYGVTVSDRRALYPFIGPRLVDSFQKYYKFPEAQAREAVTYYREYYGEQGLFENCVYDGIPETLDTLRRAGFRLAMATGKPEVYALRIAERYGLAERLDCVTGATLDDSRSQKDQVIACALTRLGIREPSRVLMVGDREHDVLGAAKLGIDCLGVLYGYGSRLELESAGVRFCVETVEDMCTWIMENGYKAGVG